MPDAEHTPPLTTDQNEGMPDGLFEVCLDDDDLLAIAQITGELLGIGDARVCLFEGQRAHTISASAPQRELLEPICRTPCQHTLTKGQLFVRSDLLNDPDLAFDSRGDEGVRFFAGAPIRINSGAVVGVLSIRDTVPRELTEHQRAGLERMAHLAGSTIQRKLSDHAADRFEGAFENLFNVSLSGTILMSPHRDETRRIVDMRLDRVNDSACEILGLPRSEWEGQLHKVAFPASRENGVVENYIRVYETGIPNRQEFFYADAQLQGWYDATSVKTKDGVAITFLDVTKRIENELFTSEQRRTLELFVKHTPAAVAVFDKKMRYLIASDRWTEDYHLEHSNYIGRSHYEVFPEIGEDWKQVHQRCLAGEVITRDEERFERADGRVEWLRWAIHPWRDSLGEIGGIIMFTEVVTKRRNADLALRESQRSLNLALECANIAMWDVDTTRMRMKCSDHWFAMLGIEPQDFEVTCEQWAELIHPDDLPVANAEVERLLSGKSDRFQAQYRVRSADLGYIWVESVGRAVERDERGMPTRAIGVLFDISARRESEEIVRASERRLNLALDCANAGLLDWNVLTDDVVFNKIWWTQLGYDPAKPPFPIGNDAWRRLVHPDDRAPTIAAIEDHFAGKTDVYEHEFRMKTRDDEYRWIRGVGRVVERTEEGKPVRILGINLDVHEQREAQEAIERFALDVAEAKTILEEQATEMAANNAALEEARELAVAASKAKTEFLANMSHEIRTPMTAILGFAELLTEPSLRPEEREAHTQTIIRNGQHLLLVINDILDISRIEAGKMTTERMECSPADIVSGVRSLLESRAHAKGISLTVEWGEHVPARCQTDPTRLRQILLNLAGNAIKFTSEGSVIIRVDLETDGHASPMLCFDVIDTGIGIPSDRIDSLFEAFSQTESSHTRRFGGTGLGLAISARLAALLGGSVRLLSSTPGRGSTFRATIDPGPIGQASSPAPRSDASANATQQHHVTSLKGRILVAEDGPDNQRLLRHHLLRAGADVHVVDDGKQAVEAANAALASGDPFDLILMDMQMPVMDGLTATSKLRESGYTRPIVALTAHAMEAQRKQCLDIGCNDHLSKPISKQDLIDGCHKWMDPSHARSA